jgi:ribonuclease J
MSLDNHRKFTIQRSDTVIISARIIPGNERPIYRMVNHFHRRGATVLTERDARVHVSGHAYRQEIKMMLSLVRPKHLVPIHGELRHLMAMKTIGRDMRLSPQNIHLVDRGDLLDITKDSVKVPGRLSVSKVMVDGRDPEGLDDVVVRDRKHLAEDGMLVVVLAIDSSEGSILTGPEIATRGFIPVDNNESAIDDLKKVVKQAFNALDSDARGEAEVVRDAIRRALRNHVVKEYGRHPMILPSILEM